jgi:hypothetical protein
MLIDSPDGVTEQLTFSRYDCIVGAPSTFRVIGISLVFQLSQGRMFLKKDAMSSSVKYPSELQLPVVG